jgi:predicted nucleic acid-binding protein
MRLYLDACALIYAVEGIHQFRVAVWEWIQRAIADANGSIASSLLSRLECRVKPLRDGDHVLLAAFDAFLGQRQLQLLPITPAIIETATDLRVRYNLKTPDSIHVATAMVHSADVFVTADAKLSRCSELRVEVVTES